jgi:hypothetical protein
MRNLIAVLCLFALTSCGAFANLSKGLTKGRELLVDVHKQYQEIKPEIEKAVETSKDIVENIVAAGQAAAAEIKVTATELKALDAEAFAKADKDGDGDLDWMEKLAYWILIGGGTLEIGRRKIKSIEERLAHERAKRKAAEAVSAS